MGDDIHGWLAKLHENPLDKIHRLVFADWCEENGYGWMAEPLRIGRIPLTRLDCHAIEMLKSCNFTPGSWDKRFTRDLPNDPDGKSTLTPRQYLWLWIMCHRYRRQIVGSLVKDYAKEVNERYRELHASDTVKPEYKAIPENDRAQEHYRKKRHVHRVNRQAKELDMPLFD